MPTLATPAPILIPLTPTPLPSESAPVVQRVLTLSVNGEAKSPSASAETPPPGLQSGVRHVLSNEPGQLREVCSPVVYNSCS